MKRIFYPYNEWEDYKAGMYRLPSVQDSATQVQESVDLLASSSIFYGVALGMISDWSISAAVNLSNKSRNRQAWLGQASCCFSHKSSEHQTKEAWHLLTKEQQDSANQVADEIIAFWESCHAEA